MILRLFEKDKLAQDFFKKANPYGMVYTTDKDRIHQPGQLGLSQFPLKYLKLILVNLFLITPNGAK